jgi:hypothetical protein
MQKAELDLPFAKIGRWHAIAGTWQMACLSHGISNIDIKSMPRMANGMPFSWHGIY